MQFTGLVQVGMTDWIDVRVVVKGTSLQYKADLAWRRRSVSAPDLTQLLLSRRSTIHPVSTNSDRLSRPKCCSKSMAHHLTQPAELRRIPGVCHLVWWGRYSQSL